MSSPNKYEESRTVMRPMMEEKKTHGVKILGYNVPVWLLVLLALVAVYLLYRMFNHAETVKVHVAIEPASDTGLDTPVVIRASAPSAPMSAPNTNAK